MRLLMLFDFYKEPGPSMTSSSRNWFHVMLALLGILVTVLVGYWIAL